jgi:alcohol dehydrogenase class IV
MLARAAVVDPELTFDVPPDVTAYTGLDTLTQLIEPFVSSRANAFVDMFCREGMGRVRDCLERAVGNGRDAHARTAMSFASLLSGLSLANAGLGVVHGFAGPLGGIIDAPHGAICAALLPEGVRANVRALREREPSHRALQRYAEAAAILTRNPDAKAEDLAPWLGEVTRRLRVRRAGALGLSRDQIPELVEKASKASSMKANPIMLTPEELSEAVEHAL